MTVTHLDNSGFVLEMGDKVLIFDYYKGTIPQIEADKKIYVLASHVHFDHFNKDIFRLSEQYPHVKYILSDDIKTPGPEGKTVYVGAREDIHVDDLKIHTLRSTDEGVAFLIRVGGITIYHAGDLNWWHWEGEGDAFNEMMRRNYQHEIRKNLEGMHIDVAFLPLDPRQGAQYSWGLDYFMRHTDTDYAFPMHMWGQYEACDQLLDDPISEPYRDRILHVSGPHQVFELDLGSNADMDDVLESESKGKSQRAGGYSVDAG